MTKRVFLFLFVPLFFAAALSAQVPPPNGVSPEEFKRAMEQTRSLQIVNRAIYDSVRPSTVQIIVKAAGDDRTAANDPILNDPFFRRFFGAPQSQGKPPSLGSGFIIDDSGLIITNRHVVDDAKIVQVKLHDGRIVEGTVRGTDDLTDIALVQIKDASQLKPIRLGDSDKVFVGDYVVALGNPFGLDGTFSTGVVSAVARAGLDRSGLKFIQTDAAINPGNSGGPLINLDGQVVGINRMIVSPTGGSVGIGFAIPINEVKKVLSEIKLTGTVTRPILGVQIVQLTPQGKKELGVTTGVLVIAVGQGSGADKAGIEKNDVVVSVDGRDVQTAESLASYIQTRKVGDRVTIEIVRNKISKKLEVILGKMQ
ncbi:MAG: trypsin-like peptidase domain-containing protein [Leptospirales bacterium]|nr:trypsin-like peptidase domain-containing protein [Leptospirales bacterium]